MSESPQISALILAGGDSTRMGTPKALLEIDGEPVWRRIRRVCLAAGCDRTVLLVPDLLLESVDVEHLPNHRAIAVPEPLRQRGPIGTILHGIRHTSDSHGWLLWAVDHPFVTVDTARSLIAEPDSISVPRFEGRRGHPVYLPRTFDREIERLATGQGSLRDLMRAQAVREVLVDDPATVWNCNTRDEFDQFLRRYERS